MNRYDQYSVDRANVNVIININEIVSNIQFEGIKNTADQAV